MIIFALLSFCVCINPGIKFDYPESTLKYMVNQIFPWVQKQVKGVKFEDIHQDVKAPIVGTVTFDITNGQISEIDIGAPSFKIISDSQIQVNLGELYVRGGASWHYKQHDFPKVSDSGTIDLSNLLVAITMDFGAVIDISHKSHIKISSSNFNIDWKQFDLKVHGGASWLYNFLISTFKGPLEKVIENALKAIIPSTVVNLLQPMVDSMIWEVPIGIGQIEFSYLMEYIKLSVDQHWMSFGVDGFFKQAGKNPPGAAVVMPDIYGTQMIQIFVSELAFVGRDSGRVVKDDPRLPMHLTTDAFALFIPELTKKYGSKPMQVTLKVDPANIPHFVFNKTEGYEIQGDFLAIFQVLNDTSTVLDAFTLDVSTRMNASIYFKQGEKPSEYSISAEVGLKDFTLKLVSSDVGQFDPKFLSEMMTSFITFFVLPNLNKYFLQGIPIPTSDMFSLKNPKLTPFDHYFCAALDFDFYPPTLRKAIRL